MHTRHLQNGMRSDLAIGGYFELELRGGQELHTGALHLNTARNALELLLKEKGFNGIYLPSYVCDSILRPIKKLSLDYEFYSINDRLEPEIKPASLKENYAFLVVNYFGLKDAAIAKLRHLFRNLIVDNAQSFFSHPIEGVDTFYSARKFFGVPDGAYLYTNQPIGTKLEIDLSWERMEHLLMRKDIGPESGYPAYLANEDRLRHVPIREMSELTRHLLKNIDYEEAARRRIANFKILHGSLSLYNHLKFDWDGSQVPMVYPFFCDAM